VKMIASDFTDRLKCLKRSADTDWVDVLSHLQNKRGKGQPHLLVATTLIFRGNRPITLVSIRKRGPNRGELVFEESDRMQFTHLRNVLLKEFQDINPCPFTPSKPRKKRRSPSPARTPSPQPQPRSDSPGFNLSQGVYDQDKELTKEERILRHWKNHGNNDPSLVVDFPAFKQVLLSKDYAKEFPKILAGFSAEVRAKLEPVLDKYKGISVQLKTLFKLLACHRPALQSLTESHGFVRDPVLSLKHLQFDEFDAFCSLPIGNPVWTSIYYLQLSPLSFSRSSPIPILFDSNLIIHRELFHQASLEPMHLLGRYPSYSFEAEAKLLAGLNPYLAMVFATYKLYQCAFLLNNVSFRRFRAEFIDDGFNNHWLYYVSVIDKYKISNDAVGFPQQGDLPPKMPRRVTVRKKPRVADISLNFEDTKIQRERRRVEEKNQRFFELKKEAWKRETDEKSSRENVRVRLEEDSVISISSKVQQQKQQLSFKDPRDPREKMKFIDALKNDVEQAETVTKMRSPLIFEDRRREELEALLLSQAASRRLTQHPTILELSLRPEASLEPGRPRRGLNRPKQTSSSPFGHDTYRKTAVSANASQNNSVLNSSNYRPASSKPISKPFIRLAHDFLNHKILFKGKGRLASHPHRSASKPHASEPRPVQRVSTLDKQAIHILPFEAQLKLASSKRTVVFGLTTKLEGRTFKTKDSEIVFQE